MVVNVAQGNPVCSAFPQLGHRHPCLWHAWPNGACSEWTSGNNGRLGVQSTLGMGQSHVIMECVLEKLPFQYLATLLSRSNWWTPCISGWAVPWTSQRDRKVSQWWINHCSPEHKGKEKSQAGERAGRASLRLEFGSQNLCKNWMDVVAYS